MGVLESKKKGMWMGGPVPLGYDVRDRTLIPNEAEAATVRMIFERHRALGSIRALVDELSYRGVHTKRRTLRDGRVVGGKPFAAGAVTHLLRNVLYAGRIPHGDQVYAGAHDAIVRPDLWAASQALLDRNAPRPHGDHRSLLAGRIRDGHGRPMRAEHANRGGRRYRYYVSRSVEGVTEAAWRLPVGDVERIVVAEIERFLADPGRVALELGLPVGFGDPQRDRCVTLAARANAVHLPHLLDDLDATITVGTNVVTIGIAQQELASKIGCPREGAGFDEPILITIAVEMKRRGHETRLVYAAPDARPAQRDPRLIQLVAGGRAAYAELRASADDGNAVRRSHLTRLARLRFLAPDIVMSILDGTQPVELTARALMRIAELPLCWVEQRRALGYA